MSARMRGVCTGGTAQRTPLCETLAALLAVHRSRHQRCTPNSAGLEHRPFTSRTAVWKRRSTAYGCAPPTTYGRSTASTTTRSSPRSWSGHRSRRSVRSRGAPAFGVGAGEAARRPRPGSLRPARSGLRGSTGGRGAARCGPRPGRGGAPGHPAVHAVRSHAGTDPHDSRLRPHHRLRPRRLLAPAAAPSAARRATPASLPRSPAAAAPPIPPSHSLQPGTWAKRPQRSVWRHASRPASPGWDPQDAAEITRLRAREVETRHGDRRARVLEHSRPGRRPRGP